MSKKKSVRGMARKALTSIPFVQTPRKNTGLPPGTLVFTGNKKIEEAKVSICRYNAEKFVGEGLTLSDVYGAEAGIITWVDVRGLHEVELVEEIGRGFHIHPLILEDILDVSQRPKFEEYKEGYFCILRDYQFDPGKLEIRPEQVAIYVNTGQGFVVSFQEAESDLLKDVRSRLEMGKGKIRMRGADYLSYALMDRIVDNYFFLLDDMGVKLEDIENEVLASASSAIRKDIHKMKRELHGMRRSISPLREAINMMIKSEVAGITSTTAIYLRDLYDHTVQALDLTETFRENINSLNDLYLSELSFRMNKVMQVLTIVATIFIPLTFIVGVYGMNFDHMPELHWRYGYPVVWTIMMGCAILMLFYFRRRDWL